MKFYRLLYVFIVLVLILVIVFPAYAQLGQTDISSFTVQNNSSTQAKVAIMFVDENGETFTPKVLNSGKANPFNLASGESFEVYLPGIPADQLPDGR